MLKASTYTRLALLWGIALPSIVWSTKSASGAAFTYLDHLKAVHTILCKAKLTPICQKLQPLAPGFDVKQCQERLDALSRANPENLKTLVDPKASKACIKFLAAKTSKCDTALMELTLQGNCRESLLKVKTK